MGWAGAHLFLHRLTWAAPPEESNHFSACRSTFTQIYCSSESIRSQINVIDIICKVFGDWSIECYDTIMVPCIFYFLFFLFGLWNVLLPPPTSVLLASTLWVCMWMWMYHQASQACALVSRLEWEWIEDALDSAHWLRLFLIYSLTYIRLHPPLLVFPFIYFSVEALLNKGFQVLRTWHAPSNMFLC